MKQRVKIFVFLLLCTFYFSNEIYAQLCQGSLGDPVVNITFGSGPNPGPPLFGLTNYTYIAGDCPQDGSYTVENSTSACFGFTWHTVTEDHTPGDVGGYMMVVNASYNPGDFFVKTVDGLCPNTTYQFAAWIYNVLQPSACGGGIKPDITFNIETTTGTVLSTYSTGDIPDDPDWKQYGFFFSTTPGTGSVVIRMTNNAPGGCGNDLLLDDITFRACGPLVTARIAGAPDSVDVCTGDASVFSLLANVSTGYNNPVYQWQLSTDSGTTWNNIAGATGMTYQRPAVTTPGMYLYRFAVSEQDNINISSCSIVSNVVAVGVNKFPVVVASSRGNCTGDTLALLAAGGALFKWAGPLNFTSNDQSPYITDAVSANSGTYYVTVTSSKGCSSKDSISVALNDKPVINAGSDAAICQGKSIQLNSTGSNITSYQWRPVSEISNPRIPNPLASPQQTTLYILTVANDKCQASDSLTITVYQKPGSDAGPDKVIIEGQSAVLNGTASGSDVVYLWTPPEYLTAPQTLTPSVNPPVSKMYALQVTSNDGCGTATDSVLVKVFKKVFIPNAFTPNNDGINDTWFIETLEAYPGAVVKVFNRYGQKVFDNNGINKPWDGKFKGLPLSSGVYVYIIDLKNNTPLMKGVVTIIL